MIRKLHSTGWRLLKKILFLSIGTVFIQPLWSASTLDAELLAKAAPDECFNGVGNPYDPNVNDCSDIGEQPKVNQAYVWGMTKTDTHIWFGTVANTLCLVNGTYHGMSSPSENDSWVCEQSQSMYPDFMASQTGNSTYLALKSLGLGDWRVPKIYRYDVATKTNVDMTPALLATLEGQLILQTLGLRSAGTYNGVVFLAGPGFGGGEMSVNMFAFNAQTGAFIGSKSLPAYNNIRKWIVADDELYTAVGVNEDYLYVEGEGNFSGRVLKWEGNVTDPFNFKEVGYLPGAGAELAVHEGRLFVTTWPGSELASGAEPSGVYMSPVLPVGGLETPTVWKEIWKATDYEPDPVVAMTYGGGAIASFDGHLYWGTMHVPLVAMMAATQAYDINTSDTEQLLQAAIATNRAISIFRASDFDNDGAGSIELLYGENQLKRYIPGSGFVDVPNNMGQTPLWGESGFGNKYNNYTWTMNVFKDKLYIGTMDWSYLLIEMFSDLINPTVREDLEYEVQTLNPGADLWRIENSNGPAEAEDTTGIGNYGSYGIRTMVSDEQNLYLGMANPMNLMTDSTDEKPEGGWELIKMREKGGSSSGGGCTYNPNNNSLDMMMLFMLALSLLYPWRRKLIK